ncbi:MAG: MarR family winged helix-turn-helix transcriptional regulator [Geminicoccaceae bacterium]
MPPSTSEANTKESSLRAVAELLDHFMRAIYSQSFVEGLNPAQWGALRFLGRANPRSRTLTEFARFHMVSKSAASDTMSALVRKELVTKSRDPEDGRIMRLDLTDRGRELLVIDPLNNLVVALRRLPPEQHGVAAELAGAIARNVFAGLSEETVEAETGSVTPLARR